MNCHLLHFHCENFPQNDLNCFLTTPCLASTYCCLPSVFPIILKCMLQRPLLTPFCNLLCVSLRKYVVSLNLLYLKLCPSLASCVITGTHCLSRPAVLVTVFLLGPRGRSSLGVTVHNTELKQLVLSPWS